MSGWTTKKLGEVCAFSKDGGNWRNLPYVGLEDIESKTARFTGSTAPKTVQSLTFRFHPGQVLYGRLRPYLQKGLLAENEGHCSTEIFPIQPTQNLNAKYFLYWLLSDDVTAKIDETCRDARMPRANMNEVLEFTIPLPLLSEQKRIVAKIDAAFEKIDKLKANAEKNLANAKELFQSALDEAFKTPKGDKVRLRDVCDVLAGYPFKGNAFSETGIKICGGLIITPTEIKWSECKHWDSSEGLEDYLLAADDIVIALDRPWIADGFKIGMIEESDLPCLLIQRTARLRAKKVIPKYLLYVLRHPAFKEYCTFTGATVPHISHKNIERYVIPCPPLAEQKQIAKRLDLLSQKTKTLQQNYARQIADCAEMRQAILREAFEGRL